MIISFVAMNIFSFLKKHKKLSLKYKPMMSNKEKVIIWLLKHVKYFLLYDILLIIFFAMTHKAIFYFFCTL